MYTRVCKWSIPNISTIYFQSQVLIFKTHTFNHFPTFSSTSLYSESSITLHEESPSEATMPAVLLWALILPPTSGCARGSWAVAISNPKGYSWIYWQVYKSEDGTWESSETQSEPQPITVQNQDPIFLGLLSAKAGAAIRGMLQYEVGDRRDTWTSEEFVKEIWYGLHEAGDSIKKSTRTACKSWQMLLNGWPSQSG